MAGLSTAILASFPGAAPWPKTWSSPMIWPPRSISSSLNMTLPVMRPVARTTRYSRAVRSPSKMPLMSALTLASGGSDLGGVVASSLASPAGVAFSSASFPADQLRGNNRPPNPLTHHNLAHLTGTLRIC